MDDDAAKRLRLPAKQPPGQAARPATSFVQLVKDDVIVVQQLALRRRRVQVWMLDMDIRAFDASRDARWKVDMAWDSASSTPHGTHSEAGSEPKALAQTSELKKSE